MPRVTFKYNIKKDVWTWVAFARRKGKIYGLKNRLDFISPELIKKIRNKNRKSAEFLVFNHLISHPKKRLRGLVIKEELRTVENLWRKIENKFFKKLEKITQKPIFTEDFKCYLTSGFMCPYNEKEKWFMISMWHSIPMNITIICHEILHLQFLYYYKKYCQRFLSKKQTEDLKEALTFLLNTDFNDLILSKDMGYPAHKKFRLKLEKTWKKEKDFKKFLDKAIEIVKKIV